MKRTICLMLLIAAALASQASEGIEFSKGSWKEMLGKAKKENKLIFIDVYTDWCGPCKKMVAEVFPQKQVADLFNASFINFKIDAEKGEGVQVAKQFEVRAFPTYLFVNGDGQLVYRTTGYMPADAFMKQASVALTEQKDPKPLAQWSVEYEKGNRSKEFLQGYLKKRYATQQPSAEIIEEWLSKLTAEEMFRKETLETLLAYSPGMEFMPGGKLFDLVTKNSRRIDSILQSKAPVLYQLQMGVQQYFQKQIVEKADEKALPRAESSVATIARLLGDPAPENSRRRIRFEYYAKNYEMEKFNAAVLDHVNNGLLKADPDAMIEKNKPSFNRYMEPFLSGKEDSAKVPNWEMMKNIVRMGEAVSWAYSLRGAAEAVYASSGEKDMLAAALGWTKRSYDCFPHFSTAAVYAGLLFRNGQKNAAIALMEEWKRSTPSKAALFGDNIEKMKTGATPLNLWK